MINVLLNISNFDEPWAYESMEAFLHKGVKVLILPLSYHEGWITDAYEWRERYGKGSEYYEELVRPFRAFGIPDKDIKWVNYYEDDEDSARSKINKADVLFFTGGYPDKMMDRLWDLGITETIRNFDGVVMGTSAGALIQLERYHLADDGDYEFQYQEGLGVLSGFDMDVHYEEDLNHVGAIIRSIEDHGLPVVACPNEGGILIDGDHFELLGGSFVCTMDDMDELYEAYNALQEGY